MLWICATEFTRPLSSLSLPLGGSGNQSKLLPLATLNPAQIFVALTSWPSFLWSTLFPRSTGGGGCDPPLESTLYYNRSSVDACLSKHSWMSKKMTSNPIGSQLTTGEAVEIHTHSCKLIIMDVFISIFCIDRPYWFKKHTLYLDLRPSQQCTWKRCTWVFSSRG